jgi:translation initiation factor 2 gamma subunit (eIF-2gamma)
MVGNKIDLVDSEEVSYDEVKKFVSSRTNWAFMYVSAK